MFQSLRIPSFRVWIVGAFISSVGEWMQMTAIGWVVLTLLTDNDAGAMGITMALQFTAPLLLVGVTGSVLDRYRRRHVLIVTQVALGVIALAAGAMLLAGALTLPLMYVFAALLGVVVAFDGPAKQAFISDIVGRESTPNAVALNSAVFNFARLLGPAIAGIAMLWTSAGWIFVVNGLSFAATIAVLLWLRRVDTGTAAPGPRRGGVWEGIVYVRHRADLAVVMTVSFLIGAFTMNFPIFASTMTLHFGLDSDAYGFASSTLAIGSLAGALLAAHRGKPHVAVLALAACLLGVFMYVAAAAPNFPWYLVTTIFSGLCVMTVLVTGNGYVQTNVDPAVRGRVLALLFALQQGGSLIGAPTIGWIAESFGPRAAIIAGGTAALLAGAIALGMRRRANAANERWAASVAVTA